MFSTESFPTKNIADYAILSPGFAYVQSIDALYLTLSVRGPYAFFHGAHKNTYRRALTFKLTVPDSSTSPFGNEKQTGEYGVFRGMISN